jgi:hypothetical protein
MAFSVVWAAIAIGPGGLRRSARIRTAIVYRRAAGDGWAGVPNRIAVPNCVHARIFSGAA